MQKGSLPVKLYRRSKTLLLRRLPCVQERTRHRFSWLDKELSLNYALRLKLYIRNCYMRCCFIIKRLRNVLPVKCVTSLWNSAQVKYDLNLVQGQYPGEKLIPDKASLQIIEVNISFNNKPTKWCQCACLILRSMSPYPLKFTWHILRLVEAS